MIRKALWAGFDFDTKIGGVRNVVVFHSSGEKLVVKRSKKGKSEISL